MKSIAILVLNLLFSLTTSAQFGTAPDFNVVDIRGNDFQLYEELDAGKPVILACMATWSAISLDVHNQHFLEDLYLEYGPEGTNQIRILFYEGDANTTIADLTGTSGNTLADWTENITYPMVNESIIQLPLEVFASNGFPSIKIISPDNYEITNDISCVKNIDEIKEALNNIITLFEDTGQDFNLDPIASDVSCYGANDGEIDLNISGGFSPNQVEWFDGSTDTIKQNLMPGEYAVTVTDALGDTLSENIVISEPAALQFSTINIINEINNQQNGSISLTIEGGTSPYTFEWSTGSTNMNLVELASGEYYITVSDTNQCKLIDSFFVDIGTNLIENRNSSLILFPNPTNKILNIKNLKEKEMPYEITNNLGQIINIGSVRNNFINLESLPAGSYQISFNNKKEKIRRQFIKL